MNIHELPKILKNERNKKGLSQMAFAKILGISQQTVGSWETGRTSPDLYMLVKIARFFDTSTDYLLGNDTTPQNLILPVSKDDIQLSDNKKSLINMYRTLDESAKTRVLRNLKGEYDDKKQYDEKANKDA